MLHLWSARPRREACLASKREKSVKRVNSQFLWYDGPFTVFAPTDEAFAKLPAGTVEDLLKPENKDKLVSILTYHVVPGKVMAADIAGKETMAKTAQGSEAKIVANDTGVMIDGAKVVSADVAADNGVIHVIDSVIMPK